MSIAALHQNQQRILQALQSALRVLRMTDQLAIVGSLAKYLAGGGKLPGDIDVLIERPLCERYWEFLEILGLHGLQSVRDVLDRPEFPWQSCVADFAHARALTIDCAASKQGQKHGALDICFKASDLDSIPRSHQWVDRLDLNLTGATRDQAIQEGRRRLLGELQSREAWLSSPVFCPEVGLYYRLSR